MHVDIVGGGPAGLYLGILLKRRDPTVRVRIAERNREGDTFGFGVVFSDATLSNFQEADPESHAEIVGSFVYWSDIVTYWKDEVFRSTGHGFCGLARVKLLDILARRARALGCELLTSTEVDDPQWWRDADVVVAADGIRSGIRTRYAETFQPDLDWRRCRFIWLGTTKKLDAFTFVFRETPFGLFQVHAYPYDNGHSTFIVECHEDVWRAAGLAERPEAEAVAWLSELFADHLGGHPLLHNNSGGWRVFPTVRNARWVHDNVVIVGDAAHTAHFSIGSGTKLAMEDAIALADALAGTGTVPERLNRYEAARRPEVERLQHTAATSLQWFEQTNHYRRLPGWQVHLSLMTRSKRITWGELEKRDPALVASVQAELGGVPPAYAPLRLRGVELANRIVVSPMCQYSAVDGVPTDWHLVHLGCRAVGGAGLVFAEATGVEAAGRISPGCTGLWNEAQCEAWARIVRFVHEHSGARIGMQLAHAGRKAATRRPWDGDGPLPPEDAWPTCSASALPYAPGWSTPEALDAAGLARVRDAFVASARLALVAGFDVLEIHMAHGYLLHGFLSPLTNQRTDAYGGDLDRRLRFPLEIVDAVRAVWPDDRPLFTRLSCTDWAPAGLSADDAVAIGRALGAHGVDVVDCSSGGLVPQQAPVYGRMFNAGFADLVRNAAEVATMAVGAITDVDQAHTLVASGRADLVALARGHLADPYFTLHGAATDGHPVRWPRQYLAAAPRRRKG